MGGHGLPLPTLFTPRLAAHLQRSGFYPSGVPLLRLNVLLHLTSLTLCSLLAALPAFCLPIEGRAHDISADRGAAG